MAQLQVLTKTFTDKLTGEPVSYSRLVVTSVLGGKERIAEFKLDNDKDYILLELMVNSTEQKPTIVTRKATADELIEPTIISDDEFDFED